MDNQGSLQILKEFVLNERTKYVMVKYHLIKDTVKKDKIRLEYVPSEENTSDIMTRALGESLFTKFRNLIGASSRTKFTPWVRELSLYATQIWWWCIVSWPRTYVPFLVITLNWKHFLATRNGANFVRKKHITYLISVVWKPQLWEDTEVDNLRVVFTELKK